MTSWHVYVQSTAIAPNTQLDFSKSGAEVDKQVPGLAAGEMLLLKYRNHKRGVGFVVAIKDKGIVEIKVSERAGILIRKATHADEPIPTGSASTIPYVVVSIDVDA